MKAAIDVLRAMKSEGRGICILGDMLELESCLPEGITKSGCMLPVQEQMIAAVGTLGGC